MIFRMSVCSSYMPLWLQHIDGHLCIPTVIIRKEFGMEEKCLEYLENCGVRQVLSVRNAAVATLACCPMVAINAPSVTINSGDGAPQDPYAAGAVVSGVLLCQPG